MSARQPADGGTPPARPRSTSLERLSRLLALVPYVISRRSVSVAETAAAFGVSEAQLIDDLNMVWCVELRGPDPYCPIDLSYEGGEIVVSEAESITRPLRLDVDEAAALLVALRTLEQVPGGAADAGAESAAGTLARTIAKVEAVAGAAGEASSHVAVEVSMRTDVAVQVRDALDRGRRLRMTYYVPGRDENTDRDVDPMRLLLADGASYVEGWCRRAEAVRLFRLDRIVALTTLDVAAEVPPQAEPVDLDEGLFRPSPDDIVVTFELTAAGRWMPDYFPCESVTELGDGRLRVVLRTRDTRWVRRLALRLAGEGRIVDPPELAAEVRAEAARALALYEENGRDA